MKALLVVLLAACPVLAHAQAVEGCSLYAPDQLELPALTIEARSASLHYYVEVQCEPGLAFQLEVSNAEPGGVLELTGPGGTPIPVRLRHSDTRLPWGAVAHGEALGGVGTGERVSYPLEVAVSVEALPELGAYRVVPEINLVF